MYIHKSLAYLLRTNLYLFDAPRYSEWEQFLLDKTSPCEHQWGIWRASPKPNSQHLHTANTTSPDELPVVPRVIWAYLVRLMLTTLPLRISLCMSVHRACGLCTFIFLVDT